MITRINHFVAKDNHAPQLEACLQQVISRILACSGCISCRLLRSTEKAGTFAIVEEWQSIADHQQAAKAIPQDLMKEAMALFATPPNGVYYEDVWTVSS